MTGWSDLHLFEVDGSLQNIKVNIGKANQCFSKAEQATGMVPASSFKTLESFCDAKHLYSSLYSFEEYKFCSQRQRAFNRDPVDEYWQKSSNDALHLSLQLHIPSACLVMSHELLNMPCHDINVTHFLGHHCQAIRNLLQPSTCHTLNYLKFLSCHNCYLQLWK